MKHNIYTSGKIIIKKNQRFLAEKSALSRGLPGHKEIFCQQSSNLPLFMKRCQENIGLGYYVCFTHQQ